jgi:hypothetical protein
MILNTLLLITYSLLMLLREENTILFSFPWLDLKGAALLKIDVV